MKMRNKNILSACNVYTIMWCIYYSQGVLYAYGSIIAKVCLLVLLSMSIYYAYRLIKQYRLPKYFRGLNYMLILFLVYGVFRFVLPFYTHGMLFDGTRALKNVLISLLPIYTYTYFALKGYITKKWLLKCLPLFFLVCLGYYYNENALNLQMVSELGSDRDEFTNNAGYMFTSLIPYVALINRKKLYQTACLMMLFTVVFMSMKRGAILIAFCGIVYLYYSQLMRSSFWKKLLLTLLLVVIGSFMYYLFEYMLSTSDYFVSRVDNTLEGDTSGRNEMYSFLLNYLFRESNVFNFLLGKGLDGTMLVLGAAAHNDWLQIAVDMGILGIVFFIVYWRYFYKSWKAMRFDGPVYLAFGIFFIMGLLKTMFSFYINDMPVWGSPLMAYCLACLMRSSLNNELG